MLFVQEGKVVTMKTHLAVLYKPYLDLILEGKKTIEARFSKVKIAPFRHVDTGDKILLKESGGPVRGEAVVKDVKYYEGLTPGKIEEIVHSFKDGLRIKKDFLQQKIHSKYATLIFLENVREVPPYYIRKKDRRGWVLWDQGNQKYIQETLDESPKEGKMDPYFSDCRNGLHSFFRSSIRNEEGYPCCRNCGADVVDWKRLHQRDTHDIEFTIQELQREWWRAFWWDAELDKKALDHANSKKADLEALSRKRIQKSVGTVYDFKGRIQPYRDGYQTPYTGNIIYYAQHATGSCCRKCIQYWHGIPEGRALNDEEIDYLTLLVIAYVKTKLTDEKRG
jgi:ASC-1-like (ASCH) protein